MEQIAINILPKGAKPACHSSQFDEGRQIRFNLFNDDTPYTLSGTETISVLVRKPDGAEVVDSVTNTSGSYIIWEVSADACELSGVCECELSIVENGIVLGSKNFTMKVEEDAYGGRNIEVRTAIGRIATFNTNMVEAFKSLKSDINPVQDLHGYSKPWSGGGGKNKFNDITGTHTINANTDTTITIGDVYLEANTTYTISCKQTPAPLTSFVRNTLSVVGGGTTTYNPAGNDYTIKPMTFTPTASGTYSIRVWGHTLSANTTYSQFQVEKGSTATAYEPYSNICPISGFSALNVTRTGKNLFDNSLMVNARTTVVGNTVTLTATGNFQGSAFAFMPVKQGYKYALNIDSLTSGSAVEVRRYDASETVTNTIVITQSTIININDGTTVKISIVYGNRTAGAGTFVLKGFNIALGEEYQSYEPYNGQTATVNFSQTVYGGVADVANGKLNVDFANDRLDAKTWSYNSSRGAFNATFSGKDQTRFNEIICSCYENGGRVYSASEVASKPDKAFYTQNNSDTIFIKDSDYADPTTWLNALGSNTICYPLATPAEITTTPENLTAISGENNVYGDTNGDTTVEYYIEV